MPTRVYLDTCVLRLAFEAKEQEVTERALAEINRDDVVFLYSRISELELLPQPIRNKREIEERFFRTYFDGAEMVECNQAAQDIALDDACKTGAKAADALHIGCAAVGRADELVTAEGQNKPMPNATAVTVRTIRYD